MAASPRIYIGRCPKVVGATIRGKRISNIRGSQPRLATLDSPFQRKGRECGAFRVYQSLLPLEGGARRAEVRGTGGMKESEKMRLKSTIYESTLSTADAVPLPRGEGKLVAASLQNRKGDARRSLKCCLRTSPLFILCGASIWLCAAPLNLEHRVE